MILTDFLPQFYQRRVCKYAGRRVPGSKPNPLKIRRVWGLLNVKSDVVAKRPPACTVPRTHSAPVCLHGLMPTTGRRSWCGAKIPTLARPTQEGCKAGRGPAGREPPHQHAEDGIYQVQ
ncbi:hypothetical protein AVEN_7703-1 [Araneus ventricosus]|uniref:Uncharacterized protein n=1 Tax=Araneus ventricosus TaxID=182803 RepID=A0A4Y2QKY2_ARAVE|nr:hypothetical protein AVEN_7703-1 [Araneus ventricosus]